MTEPPPLHMCIRFQHLTSCNTFDGTRMTIYLTCKCNANLPYLSATPGCPQLEHAKINYFKINIIDSAQN